MLVNNGWSYATNTIMPWKWRYFKDKNVESRIPVTLVICQDTSKWINLIENLFSILLLLCQRSNFPKDSHPSDERQLHCSYLLGKKKTKGWRPFWSWKGFHLAAQLPRAISRLLCSRTDIFDDCFRLQAKLGFIIYWFIFQTFAN